MSLSLNCNFSPPGQELEQIREAFRVLSSELSHLSQYIEVMQLMLEKLTAGGRAEDEI